MQNPGKLRVVVTTLEMRARPAALPVPAPRRTALLRAEHPTVAFYRFLYNTVGERWLWYERRAMDDAALGAIVQDERVEIYVVYSAGVPAGYAELDRRKASEIELAYFGLMPEFIGQGIGRHLIAWAVGRAWSFEPRRLWVTTNNLDHPRALQTYQRAGFEPTRQETRLVDDPRASGLIPAHVRVPDSALVSD